MIYSELIQLVGQYMTYQEFQRENPEVELTQNEWYSLMEGKTMRKNKAELKKIYMKQFDDDWEHRRNIAFGLIKNHEETSN